MRRRSASLPLRAPPPPMASLLRLQAFAPALNVPHHRCFLSPLHLASAAAAPLARRLSTAASTSSPEPPSSEPVIPSPNPSDAYLCVPMFLGSSCRGVSVVWTCDFHVQLGVSMRPQLFANCRTLNLFFKKNCACIMQLRFQSEADLFYDML